MLANQGAARKTLLIAALVVATLALIILAAITALWISMGGTFRGEEISGGAVVQIALAIMSCVGLGFLTRSLVRAARKA